MLHQAVPDFQIGKAIVVRQGSDITLISTGAMLKSVLDAADLLRDSKCAYPRYSACIRSSR